MSFLPTAEQIAIVEAATTTTDNLLISALAGAAKTSTLILIAKALPRVQILSLAFNKKIAEEMKTKLPPNCIAMTLNALGHRAWADQCGGRLTLKTTKCFDLLQDEIKKLSKADQGLVWDNIGYILNSCQWAKAQGHLPGEQAAARKNSRLMNDQELLGDLEEIPTDLEWYLIRKVLSRSIDRALEGLIDFGDQLLMPTIFKAIFPTYHLVLIDEAQDLSALNHEMLKRIARKRLIAVGDQNQAIYAFRGAHESGMEELKSKFSMTELQLSCSFRCPPAIVRHVQWRAPHMTAWVGNPSAGEITRPTSWSVSDLPDNCAVLCRNNAPLFRVAMQLLKSGRYPNLWGNDVGRGLLKIMKKLGPDNMMQVSAFQMLSDWEEEQRKRSRSSGALQDKLDCLRIFLSAAPTLGEAISYAEHILRSEGKVNLLTGHKAKGHEWKDVFILDEQLLRDKGQDNNLRYVMCTRTLDRLTYLTSTEMEEEEQLMEA